jgi:hypothetical protein
MVKRGHCPKLRVLMTHGHHLKMKIMKLEENMGKMKSSPTQEEEASLLEDWPSVQEEVANRQKTNTKSDKVAMPEMLKRLTTKWSGTAYFEVFKLCVKFIDCHEVGNEIAYTLLGWMLVHKEDRLVQETMHMVDGLDKLWESAEMAKEYEQMLEVLNALVVIWYQEHDQLEEGGSSEEMEEGDG